MSVRRTRGLQETRPKSESKVTLSLSPENGSVSVVPSKFKLETYRSLDRQYHWHFVRFPCFRVPHSMERSNRFNGNSLDDPTGGAHTQANMSNEIGWFKKCGKVRYT